MSQIANNYNCYTELLGGKSLGTVSEQFIVEANPLDIDLNKRYILIGVGGMGIRTIDYVKGLLNERMKPGWDRYIAFLAIDTDIIALNSMKNITSAKEIVSITRRGARERMTNIDKHPHAVRRSMNPPLALDDPALCSVNDYHPNRSRLMGRARLHDKEDGSIGVDEEIVNKLKSILGMLATSTCDTEYEVYIIGSVCGGIGSGVIPDMPALVRHALEPIVASMKLNGMIYVPDAMVGGMRNIIAKQLMANGYAALKEINYYQGMFLRPGYKEKFPYNDPACPEIEINCYFDNPILIGCSMENLANSSELAMHTVAEYIINTFLGPLSNYPFPGAMTLDSILLDGRGGKFLFHPASNETIEAAGEAHDFPYAFESFGYAKATVPRKIINAYAIDQVCKLSGIKAVELTEKHTLGERENSSTPFRANLFTTSEGTMHAQWLIQPLKGLMDKIFNSKLSAPITAHHIALKKISDMTDINHMRELKREISSMYEAYVTGVNAFVKQYGPMAYVNVYQGDFIKEGEIIGLGVKNMMTNMMRGYNPDGTVCQQFVKMKEAKQNLKNIESVMWNTKSRDGILITKKYRSQVGTWQTALDNAIKAAIDEKRYEVAIGVNKYVDECICRPASLMADQMEKFAHVLNGLADIYGEFGRGLATYEDFRIAKDNLCEINIAAEDMSTYNWLKNQVDSQISQINVREMRDELIDDFMKQPKLWLDDANAVSDSGCYLKNNMLPIAARTRFDDLIHTTTESIKLNVSIENIFSKLAAQGKSYTHIAKDIIDRLLDQSHTLFCGNTDIGLYHNSLIIPANLHPILESAIKEACEPDIRILVSNDVNGISMITYVSELPVYRLKNLKAWESAYLMRVNCYHEGLHGLSPAVEEVENGYRSEFKDERMPWRNYPALVVEDNPKALDKNEMRSHEGDLRCEMDDNLKLAEKWGIISYQMRQDGKWICIRTYLDESREWSFNVAAYETGSDGLLPTGEELMKEIMGQNGKHKEDDQAKYKKIVALAGNAALMSGEYATEELARTYVPRILRAHVPMYLEILDTLKKFKGDDGWGAEIERFNRAIIERRKMSLYPRMFVRMLVAGMIFKDQANVWKLNTEEGKPIVLMNEGFTRFLRSYDKVQATKVKSYYLYKIIKQKLGEDYAAAGSYADNVFGELMDNGKIETLEDNLSIAQMILEEAKNLIENGADFDNIDKEFHLEFIAYMETLAQDEEDARDILYFYANACDAIREITASMQ